MVADMLVNISKIKNKATENSFGQMAGVIEGNGKMENNMVKDHTFQVRVLNDLENGEMVKLCNGSRGNNLFEITITLSYAPLNLSCNLDNSDFSESAIPKHRVHGTSDHKLAHIPSSPLEYAVFRHSNLLLPLHLLDCL